MDRSVSRSLTTSEKNYAQIEKEMLAITFSLERFHQYVYGRTVEVHSDHKPLEVIIKKGIVNAPSRLQRMLLKCFKYDYTVSYVPGKYMFVADTLSKAFLKDAVKDDPEMSVVVHSVSKHLAITPERKEEMVIATKSDRVLQQVYHYYKDGWPLNSKDVVNECRPYWKLRHDISESDGLLFVGHKLLVPTSMRRKMLECIHESHQGIVKCKSRARSVLYWPGMSQQIEDLVARCEICEKYQPANAKQPMLPHDLPSRPFQKVALDFLEFNGKNYLVVTDYYSKWIELLETKYKTTGEVISKLKSIFARFGIPQIVVADNMPFNSREFLQFAKDWDFTVKTSSPLYPRSNGLAERSVQLAKSMLKKVKEENGDIHLCLLNYRATLVQGLEYSPAQLMLSRQLRCRLPTSEKCLEPKLIPPMIKNLKSKQSVQKKYYDRNVKTLLSLNEGDSVLIPSNKVWKKASVKEKHASPRSYIVTTEDNTDYRRNRQDLRLSRNPPPVIVTSNVQPDVYMCKAPCETTENVDPVPDLPSSEPGDDKINVTPTPIDTSKQNEKPKRTITVPVRFKDFVM